MWVLTPTGKPEKVRQKSQVLTEIFYYWRGVSTDSDLLQLIFVGSFSKIMSAPFGLPASTSMITPVGVFI